MTMTMSCFRVLSKPRRGRVSVRLILGVLVAGILIVFGSLSGTTAMAQEAAETPAAETPAAETPVEATPAEATPDSPAEEEMKPAAEPTEPNGSETEPESKTESPDPPQPEPKSEPVADPAWVAKGVWTMPPTEGPVAIDFSIVGEYLGELQTSGAAVDASEGEETEGEETEGEQSEDQETSDDTAAKRLGVQIRALGDGRFEARAYEGGLPGQDGYVNKKPMLLFGRRSGETLVLSGGPWAMFAGPEQCKIIDSEGTTLAMLPRTQRQSPTLGATPPEGAMVLFDGTDTSAFTRATMTDEKLLAQGADINFMLGDFDLHVEFRIPHMPKQTEQKRGNSGLYLQSRYECQVLDSFADANVFNGLGALYRFKTPKMNMAFPPLTWQTYDVRFTAARFAADGTKLRNARVTAWVNGVVVQDDEELPGPTGAGQPESPTLLPTKIQDHGDPVRFRNIWVIDRGLTGGIEFPQMAKP